MERGGISGWEEVLAVLGVEGADLENWRVRRLLIEVRCPCSECEGLGRLLGCDLAAFALVLLRLRMSVRSKAAFPWLADEAEA